MPKFLFNLYKRPSKTLQEMEKLKDDEFALTTYINSLPWQERIRVIIEIAELERDIPFIAAEMEMTAFSAS